MTIVDAPAGQEEFAPLESVHASMMNALGQLVDGVSAMASVIAQASAWRAELIDEARRWCELTHDVSDDTPARGWDAATTARRVLESELATALSLPEATTRRLIEESRALVNHLPATFESLRAGRISYRHASTLCDHGMSLPADARAEFEAAAVPIAQHLTVAKLDRTARRLRERMHPDSIAERRRRSVEDRTVFVSPANDGMAWLTAYLPCEQAVGIHNRISDIAAALRTTKESRTLSQLRADVLGDLLLNGDPTDPRAATGIRPTVLVTVPALTLLDRDADGAPDRDADDERHGTREQATLEGYGPIDDDTARRISAYAPSFFRILTHPETGAVLSVGRDSYTVPSDLRRWLRVRDETCRAPGCNQPARRCDIDHAKDWQHGGHTSHDNLAHLCPAHHQLKHHTAWDVRHLSDGVLGWVSPTGRRYETEPATRIRPGPRFDGTRSPDRAEPDAGKSGGGEPG